MRRISWLLVLLGACQSEREPAAVAAEPAESATGFAMTSSAFENGRAIPKEYTADGSDTSPPLSWSGAPAGTKAFVLIADDPDAPVGTWDHWVVIDIPAAIRSLAAGAALPAGAVSGKNSWKREGYGGPAPPPGKPHRYYFKLYALREPLGLAAGATKAVVEPAMQGKVLGEATWMGTYGR